MDAKETARYSLRSQCEVTDEPPQVAANGVTATSYPIAAFPPNALIEPWVEGMLKLDLPGRRSVLKRFTPKPLAPLLYKYFSSTSKYSLVNLKDVLVHSLLRLSPPVRVQ